MAERTPYFRASYDAVATTPRPPTPPTTTGLPRRDGLSRCSTAPKNASRSRCRTLGWDRTAHLLDVVWVPSSRAAPTAGDPVRGGAPGRARGPSGAGPLRG